MTHILLPEDTERRLVFYLAMEEWLAAKGGSSFFLWQTAPTVIYGRNQDPESEFDVDYCRHNGIEFYRRKSGGGCVYSDRGNLMLSYIVPETGVEKVFSGYLDKLASVLRSLGAPAVVTEHNDVTVDGRKVSGNAFFCQARSSIVHGTLLIDSDFDTMQRILRPSAEKLARHSVKSVRARVGNLKDTLDIPVSAIREALISSFCSDERCLTGAEIAEIEKIEKTYLDPVFLLGKVR